MAEQLSQWQELADRVEALALKLKLHAEQADSDGAVRDAMGRLRADVDDAFKAAGSAVQDQAVREDVREVDGLLADALDMTFSRVGDEVRDLFGRRS